MSRIFVGVAWPYANGPFHLGHLAGAYLPGDIFSRYHRLRGDEVLMVSGSDMHGTPTLLTAEREGVAPEVVANRNDRINREAFARLGISFDLFTTTRTPVHERTVDELFLKLLEDGYIDRRTEENAYCPKDRRFLPDRYVTGECPHCHNPKARGDECDNCGRVLEPSELGHPVCSICGTPAEFRPSEHFYLLLDKLSPQLDEYLIDKTYWRSNVLGVVRHFQDVGLRPTPITRDIEWGVPIPLDGYDGKRFYVWFEALIGYLSASREWGIRTGRPEAYLKYWGPGQPVRHYYFVGKDNIFQHTLVWPGILLGHGDLPLPYDVPANEWLRVRGGKISKSSPEDEAAFAPALLARYAPDVIRFYAALLAPQNHDTELDWNEFHQVMEEVLANQYGNLVQRLLVLTRDRYAGRVPTPPDGWEPTAPGGVGDRIREAHTRITSELEAVHLKEALDLALAEVRDENRRFHDAQPWRAEEKDRAKVLYEGLWLLKALATWLAPYLPFSSADVFRMLGYREPPGAGNWDGALVPVVPDQALGEIRPLFPREMPSSKGGPPGADPKVTQGLPPLLLRAATIASVEPHPSADKLYVLRLDVGEASPRTVVAGLRPFYSPEQLQGRRIVLLSNLEPRTIRRITSQGMLLAADNGERALLIEPPEGVEPGTLVDGAAADAPTIGYAAFDSTPLRIGRVERREGSELVISIGDREVRATEVARPGDLVVVRLTSPDAASGTVLTMAGGRLIRPDGASPSGSRVR
ncbi:MAG: methionine--tRNA ligase [Thermoplasmata archaeon]